MKPLEDAPFHIYLQLITEEGYESDAEVMEALYVDLLTSVKLDGQKPYTVEQVMKTPYKNLVKAAEIIMNNAQTELQSHTPMVHFDGQFMSGTGAEQLSPQSLGTLAQRMQQRHEQEKMRLAFR